MTLRCPTPSSRTTSVKPDSNSGGNRESNNAYYHAQSSTEVLLTIMSCIRKHPTEQDAVKAITRQRDCITQAAAVSEVPLPIATGSDQASTAAPADDDQSLFGREALRMVEEIMDFQRFNTVTWDSIMDL